MQEPINPLRAAWTGLTAHLFFSNITTLRTRMNPLTHTASIHSVKISIILRPSEVQKWTALNVYCAAIRLCARGNNSAGTSGTNYHHYSFLHDFKNSGQHLHANVKVTMHFQGLFLSKASLARVKNQNTNLLWHKIKRAHNTPPSL